MTIGSCFFDPGIEQFLLFSTLGKPLTFFWAYSAKFLFKAIEMAMSNYMVPWKICPVETPIGLPIGIEGWIGK